MADRFYELTTPQKSIWNTEKFFEGTNVNNICAGITVLDELNEEALKEAVFQVVKDNKSFRTRIVIKDNKPLQYFKEFEPFGIEIIELDDDKKIDEIREDLINYHFTIIDSDLFCFKIIRFCDGHGILLFTVHHIIADSWSLGLFAQNVMREYFRICKKEPKENSENFQYTEYIKSEEEYLQSNKFQKDKDYWNNLFKTIPDAVSFPSEKENTQVSDYKSNRETFNIPETMVKAIEDFCAQNHSSIFHFIMAVYSIYLSRVSNQNEFVIGTPILNRTNFKEKQTMGMFVNTIPVRISTPQDKNFKDFLHELGINILNDLKHQRYSYTTLLEDLRKANPSVSKLYNVVVSYQVTKAFNKDIGNYSTDWYGTNHSIVDLTVQVTDLNDSGDLAIVYDYLAEKYTRKDIKELNARIFFIIDQILESDDILLKDIQVVTPAEQRKILYDFNKEINLPDENQNIIEMFNNRVKENPEKDAVIFENSEISYKELDKKANNLANYLRVNNIKNNDVIAILMERSINLIVSIFGAVKSGASFVLIDSALPTERINYILEDSGSKYCITDEKNSENFKDSLEKLNVTNIDKFNFGIYSDENPKVNYDNNICIIYTSGSTGRPKGVLLHKIGYYNLINAFEKDMKISKYDRKLSIATISFDMFMFEVMNAILLGNTLVLANFEEQKDPISMSKLIKKNNVEFFVTTPSRVELLLMKECKNPLQNVKAILLGGERFTSSLYSRIRENTNAKIYNSFGPTEVTSACTNKLITSEDINVGRPLSNTNVFICDPNANLLPIGVTGEICASGLGIANGYLNMPEVTAEKFIKNPYGDGLLYRTGDLGKYLENGEIQYVDRLDNQVKIRGLRIELGEIENKIIEVPSIKSCAVIKKKDAEHEFLCAYFTADQQVDILDIRKHLEKFLPKYMIPNFFIQLKELPHTPNGKIDRKKLPEIHYEQVKYKKPSNPRNELDEKLIKILEDVLKIDSVNINDSFFDLGGDSLSAINLSLKIQDEFHSKITVKDILESPSIKDISDMILEHKEEPGQSNQSGIEQAEDAPTYHTSSAQKRIYYASLYAGEDSVLYNTSGCVIFEDSNIDVKKLEKCIQELIKRHESLRTCFIIEDKTLKQKIIPEIEFHLDVLNNMIYEDLDQIAKDLIKPFDLSKAPLFRAKFIRFTNQKTALFIDTHHIIFDGTSMNIFIDELCKLYNGQKLPRLKLTYKDYSTFEYVKINSNQLEDLEKFWLDQFKDGVPTLNLPTTSPRGAVKSFEGSKAYLYLNEEETKKLQETSKKLGVTPYIFLLTCYYILLSKYSNSNDIVIGTPIIGRDLEETYSLIGMFVNTLAIRNKINSNDTFDEFLNQVKEKLYDCYKYQTYPFDELVRKLNLKKNPGRNQLFDTMFIYQNAGTPKLNFGNEKATLYIPDNKTAKFDLSVEAIPENDKIKLSFEYATKLYSEDFIQKFAKNFVNEIIYILDNLNARIADIKVMSKEEYDEVQKYLENNKKAESSLQASGKENKNYIAPKTELQKNLIKLYEEILNVKPIGIDDNFFDLGGDSLLAINLNMKLHKITDNISYSDIFRYPTVKELSEKIESNNENPLFDKIEDLPNNFEEILDETTKKEKIGEYHPEKGVLLTGATGFLGIHVLQQLIDNEKTCNIYCIIKDEPNLNAEKKITQRLHYYFGNKYDSCINNRIFVITGDITKDNLGLTDEQIKDLSYKVDLVINSAANVSHYGNYKDFYNTNVKSVKTLLEFCKKYNKKLYQISTTSVYGDKIDDSLPKTKVRKLRKPKVKFDESKLYIGQVIDNVYVRSKFEAETLVLDAINSGLDGYIMRMGNLMPRYSDGVFQINPTKNAFITRFAAFAELGVVPDYLLKLPLNITPVDSASEAVYKIITHPSKDNRVFHVSNTNTITTKKYLKTIQKEYNIKIVSEKEFVELTKKSINNNLKNGTENILRDFDNQLHLNYKNDIITSSKFTEKYLRKIGFKWPKITKDYLKKFNSVLRRLYYDTKE